MGAAGLIAASSWFADPGQRLDDERLSPRCFLTDVSAGSADCDVPAVVAADPLPPAGSSFERVPVAGGSRPTRSPASVLSLAPKHGPPAAR